MADIVSLKRDIEDTAPQEQGVLRITLDNPPANLLSVEVMRDIQAELDRARDDSAVRVIVIAAAGKMFCAGHDLKQMTAHRGDADGHVWEVAHNPDFPIDAAGNISLPE